MFSRLIQRKVLQHVEREGSIPTSAGRKQIDFLLSVRGIVHLCELKALCISQAAGTPRNLGFYFRDDHLGLVKDFRKLDTLPGQNKWVLAFVYPNPKHQLWQHSTASLPNDFHRWRCVTEPSDFPDYLFIAAWRSIPSASRQRRRTVQP